MKISAKYKKHTLIFKFDAGTSRGVLKTRDTYYVKVTAQNGMSGIGECGPLPGLSMDDLPDFEEVLDQICQRITAIDFKENFVREVISFIPLELPSVRFGFETALLDMLHGGKKLIYDNDFYRDEIGIPINGLIWMGNKDFMLKQIREKIDAGFTCLKMKIGAIDFGTECELLAYIRNEFPADKMILRMDANGAFPPEEALEKLQALSHYQLHSIEQPIGRGQSAVMAKLCRQTPVKIALDEELIGINERKEKIELLDKIKPQYIILKPALLGGFSATSEWIKLASERSIGWWITSALESNIGLNAISQFTAEYDKKSHQGLGTGQLYTNNITSPLEIEKGYLNYNKGVAWDSINF